jgi:hypothetical protein
MKKFFRFFPIIFVACALHAQAPSFTWARSIAGFVSLPTVALDSVGNSYFAGGFTRSIAIGEQQFTAEPSSSFFIAKFDGAGNMLWAKQAEGARECHIPAE